MKTLEFLAWFTGTYIVISTAVHFGERWVDSYFDDWRK